MPTAIICINHIRPSPNPRYPHHQVTGTLQDLEDAANQFRQQHPQVETMPMVNDLGRINVDVFKRTHPVVGNMLMAFVVMTCLLLYFGTIIETWPNSETLEALALKAIDIILGAHAVDGNDIAETCKLPI